MKLIALLTLLCVTACQFGDRSIEIEQVNLFPEGIAYHPDKKQFILGSLKDGTVRLVKKDGTLIPFVEDEALISTIGLCVDAPRNRLYVAISDVGVAKTTSPLTQKKLAAVGVYDLQSGDRLAYHALHDLYDGAHFANDIAVDADGRAYITDSFSPVIYTISPDLADASVFFSSPHFKGEGFNLNGIVVHPDGYLIVSRYNDGSLYKIPLDAPRLYQKIKLSAPLFGADGLLLEDLETLIVVQNDIAAPGHNQVHRLMSTDLFETAKLVHIYHNRMASPTTVTRVDDTLFTIDSHLPKLFTGYAQDRFQIVHLK